MTLLRKCLRDLRQALWAWLAVACITALGVGIFFGFRSCYGILTGAHQAFLRQHRLPDLILSLEGIPPESLPRLLLDFPIQELSGRSRAKAQVHLEGQAPIEAHALGIPCPRRPVLADLRLVEGRWPSPAPAPELLLHPEFAHAHGLRPGHQLRLQIEGTSRSFAITGLAEDAEHVLLLPPSGGLAPDPERFGVVWMAEPNLAGWRGAPGTVNEVLLTLPGSASPEATQAGLERRLEPFGYLQGHGPRGWPAVQILEDKIQGLEGVSVAIPSLFLVLAAALLHLLLGRLVEDQRTTLGTLRAVGYTQAQITWHVLSFGWIAAGFGGLGGLLVGSSLQRAMLKEYAKAFSLPGLVPEFSAPLAAAALAVALGAGLLGAWGASWRAARLSPAESMRPRPPEVGRRNLLEALPFLWKALPFALQLPLRGIFRNPRRSLVSTLAVSFAASLVVSIMALLDASSFLVRHHFEELSHEDWRVQLLHPIPVLRGRELVEVPSRAQIEAQLEVGVELLFEGRRKKLSLTGISPQARLTTPLDARGQKVTIPPAGLVLARALAERLGVRAGDRIQVRPLEGSRKPFEETVTGVVDVYIGLSAWCQRESLARHLGSPGTANVFLLRGLAPGDSRKLSQTLETSPQILGALERTRALELFETRIADAQRGALRAITIMAWILALAVLINHLLVTFHERRRELATFRTLGFTEAQVARILFVEAGLLAGLGSLLGLLGGKVLLVGMALSLGTDLFRFPARQSLSSLVGACLTMLLASLAAALLTRWVLHRFAWLEALKIKE